MITNPASSRWSAGSSSPTVPYRAANTPPRSMSPTTITGSSAARASPMLARSPARRLISAGLPAPSQIATSYAARRPAAPQRAPDREPAGDGEHGRGESDRAGQAYGAPDVVRLRRAAVAELGPVLGTCAVDVDAAEPDPERAGERRLAATGVRAGVPGAVATQDLICRAW